ncbi:MAG: nitrogenase iron-molybdenum cofactor biosynthesis protein NifE [Thermodesulfovibrionales bacterium]|jgi:nitrogenase molybdenum-cofactor synthesis protein NifE
MTTAMDRLLADGCDAGAKDKVCRSRGGESCAFDGAMIVLQPIADSAHIVHGPIACCGNSWEGRGTLSSKGSLHTQGFTTDMGELDIVYGSEEKLLNAIIETKERVKPKAIFVYATCVSGIIGEDIEAVCKKAEGIINGGETARGTAVPLQTRVIPVNAPGFVGPKNLGNRIAGETLLDQVIGTGEPPFTTEFDINLIGEYNIAGDLWLVEPLLREAGIRILSRITGDSSFDEITWAHRAQMNLIACSRALINMAKAMERKYGVPYAEVSFYGKTEMAKALRAVAAQLDPHGAKGLKERIEALIQREEKRVDEALAPYSGLRGKKAVLYSGGVKSWSFISALMDLGIEIVAVGTKKSSIEDEEKMRAILGDDAPLVEDVTPKNLLRLLKEKGAHMLIAGGRNLYLGVKEGYPFVDVNQERHTAYAGYEGLINLAREISHGMDFYERQNGTRQGQGAGDKGPGARPELQHQQTALSIDPLKHSPAIGAAIAFQGINRALPVIHGGQGCTFLGKVLLTRHFREPIALASTKLFTEDVVMGSEGNLSSALQGFMEKNRPEVIGVLSSGLTEVKGDDVSSAVKELQRETRERGESCVLVPVSTADYDGGLEKGYAKAVESVIRHIVVSQSSGYRLPDADCSVNFLVGSHLSPADFTELREICEAFGIRPIILPDLSCLDGSREGVSALATGGTRRVEIEEMGGAVFTVAIGASMEGAALLLKEKLGIEYRVFDSIAGLSGTDEFMETLAALSGKAIPSRFQRQRRVLMDGMRDAHFFYGGKRVVLALEPDLAIQTSQMLHEMGATVERAVIPAHSPAAGRIKADEIIVGDLTSLRRSDLIISGSHAENRAQELKTPLWQMGFPVYTTLSSNARVTIGYRGSLGLINSIADLFLREKEVEP